MSGKNKDVIAIVDDEPCLLSAIEQLLDEFEFTAEIFNSAEAFLARCRTSNAICVVADMNMSGMSGIEMLLRIKSMGSKTPVIFMTGQDLDTTRKLTMNAGCAAYLEKPFSGYALVEAIRQATRTAEANASFATG